MDIREKIRKNNIKKHGAWTKGTEEVAPLSAKDSKLYKRYNQQANIYLYSSDPIVNLTRSAIKHHYARRAQSVLNTHIALSLGEHFNAGYGYSIHTNGQPYLKYTTPKGKKQRTRVKVKGL